jgi:peptidoglycan/LPS O-acetylase OafA/YrhL
VTEHVAEHATEHVTEHAQPARAPDDAREASPHAPRARAVALDHDRFLALRRFEDLDGLRALAVLGVIWHHTAGGAFPGSALSWAGSQGVTLFFAISGFLITSLLLRERDRRGRIDLRAFVVRRTLRIFPVFYLALALYVALVWLLERNTPDGREFFGNVFYFATYTSNWFVEQGERTIFYFAWSLATEEQFYLIWPPLLMLLGTNWYPHAASGGRERSGLVHPGNGPAANRRALVFLSIAVTGIVAHQIALGMAGDGAGTVKWLQRVPLALVLAAGFAVALHDKAVHARIAPWFAHPWSPVAAVLLLAYALIVPGVPEVVTQIACAWLVAALCAAGRHPFAALLRLRGLVYVGTISYGMYLVHMLASGVVKRALKFAGTESYGIANFVGTGVATIVIAGLCFKYFETPILGLKRRFER